MVMQRIISTARKEDRLQAKGHNAIVVFNLDS